MTRRTVVLSRTRFEGQDRWAKTLSKTSKVQATVEEARGKEGADSLAEMIILITHPVIIGILPCVKITSLKQDAIYGKRCRFRHGEGEEIPSKKSKKSGGKGSVALLKEPTQMSCVSRSSSEKVFSTTRRKIGIEAHRQILLGHVAPKKIWKERIHREESLKSVKLMSVILALLSLRRGHKR